MRVSSSPVDLPSLPHLFILLVLASALPSLAGSPPRSPREGSHASSSTHHQPPSPSGSSNPPPLHSQFSGLSVGSAGSPSTRARVPESPSYSSSYPLSQPPGAADRQQVRRLRSSSSASSFGRQAAEPVPLRTHSAELLRHEHGIETLHIAGKEMRTIIPHGQEHVWASPDKEGNKVRRLADVETHVITPEHQTRPAISRTGSRLNVMKDGRKGGDVEPLHRGGTEVHFHPGDNHEAEVVQNLKGGEGKLINEVRFEPKTGLGGLRRGSSFGSR